ncbi:MAG: hypothetical protein AAFX87_14920 [Bacteroidota bacterium]
MPTCEVIKYKDIDIVYTDITNASPEEAIAAFERGLEIIGKMPPKSVYSLVNADGARFNSSLIQKIKEAVKKNNPYVRATAVSGLSQLSRLMVNSIISFTGRQMKLTETTDEGKEWLYAKAHDTVKS